MSKTCRTLLAIAVAAFVALPAVPAQAAKSRGGSRDSVGGNRNSNSNRNTNTNKNVNVNSNRNVNRDVDIDIDVDHHGHHGGCCYHDPYHPIATAAAITTSAVVTAAVIGSMTYTLPVGCSTVIINGFAYQQCGSVWYQPQISAGSTTYVVINPPR